MFTPPDTDVSVQFLNKILGTGWQAWATGGSASGAGSVLATMFASLNLALLALAVGVTVWSHIHGTAEMARTGQTKHNTWTFLRQSGVIFMLAPTPWTSGFSIIQVIVLAVTAQSIGLADQVWNAGSGYVVQNAGQVSPPATNVVLPEGVIAGLMDAEGFGIKQYSQPIMNGDQQIGFQFGFQGLNKQYGLGGVVAIPPQGFGVVTVSCSPDICPAVAKGLQSVQNSMIANLANAVASWLKPGVNGQTLPAGVFAQAQSAYASAVQAAIASNLQNADSGLQQALQAFQASATGQGWAGAGLYFAQLARWNASADANANSATVSYKAPDTSLLMGAGGDSLSAALATIDVYTAQEQAVAINGGTTATAIGNQAAGGGSCTMAGGMSGGMAYLKCLASAPAIAFNNAIASALSSGDPLANLQAAGQDGIDLAEAALSTYAAERAAAAGTLEAAEGVERASTAVPVIGATTAAAGAVGATASATVSKMLDAMSLYVNTVLVTLLVASAVAAYYLPVVPALLYALAVIGWSLIVLEMLVAAPLWAFSHIFQGEGITSNQSRAGYFHLMDVLARPALLVLGLFLAILVVNTGCWMIGQVIVAAFSAGQAGYVTGLVGALAGAVITIMAVSAVVTMGCKMIVTAPSTVMRWLGQSMGVEAGAAQVENKISGLFIGAMRAGGGDVGGTLASNAKAARAGFSGLVPKTGATTAAADLGADAAHPTK